MRYTDEQIENRKPLHDFENKVYEFRQTELRTPKIIIVSEVTLNVLTMEMISVGIKVYRKKGMKYMGVRIISSDQLDENETLIY